MLKFLEFLLRNLGFWHNKIYESFFYTIKKSYKSIIKCILAIRGESIEKAFLSSHHYKYPNIK